MPCPQNPAMHLPPQSKARHSRASLDDRRESEVVGPKATQLPVKIKKLSVEPMVREATDGEIQ